MTTAQLTAATTINQAPENLAQVETGQRCRISFRQPVSSAGSIDAAWWPRSRDLGAELPALLDVLWTAGRELNRITYHLRDWDPAPHRMQIEGRTVRLGGFTVGDPHTVTLCAPWGRDRRADPWTESGHS